VSLLAANRDPTEFSDADRFDPDRPPAQRHVAFGQGIHACIGNILARMEAKHAVRALGGARRTHRGRPRPPAPLPAEPDRAWLVELPVQVHRLEAPQVR
jgi:cytochrome P450